MENNELKKTAKRIAILYNKILDDREWEMPDLDELVDLSRKDGIEWQARQSPWISVEDRMPETNRSILIKTDHGAIFNGEYNDDHKTWYWMDGVLIETLDGVPSYTSMCSIQEDWKVTHWMEIPE